MTEGITVAPEPGQLVRVRDRLWVVGDVARSTQDSDPLAEGNGQPQTTNERTILHWPLEFPEIFLDRPQPGFDAIVGNPPFLGGQRITGTLGTAYREHLVQRIARGARGSADLSAYVFLRAARLVREDGGIGLLATNTIGQGASVREHVGFYIWPSDRRPPVESGHAVLHAKAAVADDHTALITSANLTEHAIRANMELGVLVRGGPVPRRLHEHFTELILNRILVPPE